MFITKWTRKSHSQGACTHEHDNIALTEEELGENHYKLSARHEVDYLNEMFKLELPESENYETLGGMIVNFTEGIPESGEVVKIAAYDFHILEVSNTKIELVEMRPAKIES